MLKIRAIVLVTHWMMLIFVGFREAIFKNELKDGLDHNFFLTIVPHKLIFLHEFYPQLEILLESGPMFSNFIHHHVKEFFKEIKHQLFFVLYLLFIFFSHLLIVIIQIIRLHNIRNNTFQKTLYHCSCWSINTEDIILPIFTEIFQKLPTMATYNLLKSFCSPFWQIDTTVFFIN